MDRSVTCSSFTPQRPSAEKVANGNGKLSLNIRKAVEMRQTHMQKASYSDDSLNSLSNSMANASLTAASEPPTGDASTPNDGAVTMRRRCLSRQISTDIPDDQDYHADLEEEDEEEYENERRRNRSDNNTTATKHLQHFAAAMENRSEEPYRHAIQTPISPRPAAGHLPFKKQIDFQRHRPISESALQLNSPPLSAKSTASSTTTCSTSSSYSGIALGGGRRRLKHDSSFDSCPTPENMSPLAARRHNFFLKRDSSVHSDSSRYSSVDSLLEARKPDPEAILINLGFAPADGSDDILSRIPKRFLKPSQVKGIDTDAFVKRLQMASSLADHSVLGYRGLTGNPDAPPSTIVAKIMERFEVNQRKKSMGSVEHTIR